MHPNLWGLFCFLAAAQGASRQLDEWNKISNPLYAFIPEFDDYLRPPKRAGVLNQ